MVEKEGRRRQTAAKQDKRRGGGLRALSTSLPAVSKRALGRRGFADASLLAEWPAIVGRDLACSSEPLRLAFRNRNERVGGTLLLRVEPAFAPILQHLEPQLLERVNGYFGYRAVEEIRIRQGRIKRRPKEEVTGPESEPELWHAMKERLASVPDDALRQALSNLAKRFQVRGDKGS